MVDLEERYEVVTLEENFESSFRKARLSSMDLKVRVRNAKIFSQEEEIIVRFQSLWRKRKEIHGSFPDANFITTEIPEYFNRDGGHLGSKVYLFGKWSEDESFPRTIQCVNTVYDPGQVGIIPFIVGDSSGYSNSGFKIDRNKLIDMSFQNSMEIIDELSSDGRHSNLILSNSNREISYMMGILLERGKIPLRIQPLR